MVKRPKSLKPNHIQLASNYQNLFQSTNKRVIMEGPAGTGKTTAGVLWMFAKAMEFPHCRILIVRKTRASMTESILNTFESFDHGKEISRGIKRQFRASYREPNGSEYIVHGLDNPDRIMSSDYDLIYVCEATEISREEYEALLSRLRHGKVDHHQIILDLNPGHPQHWINIMGEEPDVLRIKTTHQDNLQFWSPFHDNWTAAGKDYLNTLSHLSGVRRKRLLLGEWAASDGLVYPEFEKTLVEERSISGPAVSVACGVDWGWTKPTCILVGVLTGNGRLHIVEEVYKEHMTREDVEAEGKRLVSKWGVERFYCDARKPEIIHELKNLARLPVRPNKLNSIEAGVSYVADRIANEKLIFWPDCPQARREIGNYENDSSGTPVDGDDHAMDALRYLVAGIDYKRMEAKNRPMEVSDPIVRNRLNIHKNEVASVTPSLNERWAAWRNEAWTQEVLL